MRPSLRLPAALLAALAVAEAGVLAFRPREHGPEPKRDVSARAYFSPGVLAQARGFRTGQLWLGAGVLVVEIGALVLLWRGPPRRLARLAARRGVIGGAAAGALLAVTLTVAGLPLHVIMRERAKDVGLVTRNWTGYASDVALSTAIGAAIAGAGGALLIAIMRRTGRRWWIPGAVAVIGYGAATTMLTPVLLDPLFNKFEPLKPGALRSDVLRLAEQAGVEVGEVYVMDASKRTTGANAYVNGLGATKRVVLYDTLLRDFPDDEVRSVVAHELGHVKHHDVPKGLLYLALTVPLGLLAAALLAERLGADASRPERAVPAVALSLALIVPPVTVISNQLSRAVELRADRFALRLTHEPKALIGLQRRLTVQNVSNPDPPAIAHWLLGTHPTALERIGLAEAVRRDGRPAADRRTPAGS